MSWGSTASTTSPPSPPSPPAGPPRGMNFSRRQAIAPVPAELHLAVDLGEERVVPPHADVLARVEEGADLADQDVAGDRLLRAVPLTAAGLTGGVTLVARRALSSFVSHGAFLLASVSGADGGDEDLGEGLPVAALLGPAFLLLPEVDDLLVLVLEDDLALHGGAGHDRATHLRLALAADQQHV